MRARSSSCGLEIEFPNISRTTAAVCREGDRIRKGPRGICQRMEAVRIPMRHPAHVRCRSVTESDRWPPGPPGGQSNFAAASSSSNNPNRKSSANTPATPSRQNRNRNRSKRRNGSTRPNPPPNAPPGSRDSNRPSAPHGENDRANTARRPTPNNEPIVNHRLDSANRSNGSRQANSARQLNAANRPNSTRRDFPSNRRNSVSSSRDNPTDNGVPEASASEATESSRDQAGHSGSRHHSKSVDPTVELEILDLIKLWSACYLQLSKRSLIAQLANSFLQQIKHSDRKVSNSWYKTMFKRQENFEKWWKQRKAADSKQKVDKTAEQLRLRRFISSLTACITDKQIPDSNIYAVSHTGYATTIDRKIHLTVPHPKTRKSKGTRSMASVISAFAGNGKPISPYVIFKKPGATPGSDVVETTHAYRNSTEYTHVYRNSTGWITDEGILFDWLTTTFEPATNPDGLTGEDAPARLLLLDGEKIEITPEFFVACMNQNIAVFAFPLDSAKLSNPLETAITSIFEARYTNEMRDCFTRQNKDLYSIEEDSFCRKIRRVFLEEDRLVVAGRRGWKNSCLLPPNVDGLRAIVYGDTRTPFETPRTDRYRDVSVHRAESLEVPDEGEDSDVQESRRSRWRSRPGVNPDSGLTDVSSERSSTSEDEDESGNDQNDVDYVQEPIETGRKDRAGSVGDDTDEDRDSEASAKSDDDDADDSEGTSDEARNVVVTSTSTFTEKKLRKRLVAIGDAEPERKRRCTDEAFRYAMNEIRRLNLEKRQYFHLYESQRPFVIFPEFPQSPPPSSPKTPNTSKKRRRVSSVGRR